MAIERGEVIGVIANILSIITITLCLVLKIPQILNVYKLKSAEGLNLYALLMELISYSIMACYNYCNGYALLSYMEYPILLVQEIILIFLVLKYSELLNIYSLGCFGIYFAIVGSFVAELLPKTILAFLAPMCTPVSALSKVVQLMAILKTRNAESISILTWFLSAFTNLTRIFTIYVDSADTLLLVNFSISALLSSSVLVAAIVYKNPNHEH